MYGRTKEGERPGSHNGRGIDEVLEVIKLLNDAGIICCVVAGKALVYYGAHRVPTVGCPRLPPKRDAGILTPSRTGIYAYQTTISRGRLRYLRA
jgi:hypothetical protein